MTIINKVKKQFTSACMGGIIGAATALCFAPKAGKQLRQDVRDGIQTSARLTKRIANRFKYGACEAQKKLRLHVIEWKKTSNKIFGQVAYEFKHRTRKCK